MEDRRQVLIERVGLRKSVPVLALAAGLAAPCAPAVAQQGGFQLEEIVVTARRREELLQDVPASITVFNQQQLNNANITTAGDLATYTPSLHANNRFGADSTTFAIRGFSQELRTTASVGVYFAEVVAPRGANMTQSGDGAGPGDLFDLENVQVLKGPQGTLFGRNTTGGAVLLTPKKPTYELEGYAELSGGNYNMLRAQGVLNLPLGEAFRVRLGVDHQEQDGYLNNISNVGPDDFGNTDYTAARVSAVWDVSDNVENYTIFKYTESTNNGAPYGLIDCDPSRGLGPFCAADLAARQASGNFGEYDVNSFMPLSENESELMQIINTTTWLATDNLTVKNILSFAEFENRQNFAIYGTDWNLPFFTPQSLQMGMPAGVQPFLFQMVGAPDFPTTDQETFVEEFQLQGVAFDGRFDWQVGLYYEKSKPGGIYGSQNPSQLSCDMSTVQSADVSSWRCNNMLIALGALQQGEPFVPAAAAPFITGSGTAVVSRGGVTYENKAVYAQGTYEFTDQWSLTAGLRYTDDETNGWIEEDIYYFDGSVFGGYFAPGASQQLRRTPETSSSEPTWMLSLEYQPDSGVLLYGKYARGYRQGSVNLASLSGWDTHGPEEVDTYELGSKFTFGGSMPGTFNVAAFYNDFKNQQVQFGYLRATGVGTTAILNAGASTIAGVEIDANIFLTENFSLSAGYAYLDTEVDELHIPTPAEYPAGVGVFSGTSTAVGEPLSYAPENKLVLGANYRVPMAKLGELVASATYVYNDEMQAVSRATSPYAVLPSYDLVNLNLNWNKVAGSPVDLSLFATNIFDEEYMSNVTGNWASGIEYGRRGVPRMYGARLKYNF